MTEKQDGSIKAIQFADRQKQQEYIHIDKSASPTVSNETIFITCAIKAKQQREIAIFDLPGAFLHAINDEDVVMYIQGRLAEIMAMVASQTYRKYIAVERGQKVLHVKVHKALYGILKSPVLFYSNLWDDLVGVGFSINPYNPCVANKMINGH